MNIKPRIRYDAPNGLWMAKSEDSPYHQYGSTIQEAYDSWKKRTTFSDIVDRFTHRMNNHQFVISGQYTTLDCVGNGHGKIDFARHTHQGIIEGRP